MLKTVLVVVSFLVLAGCQQQSTLPVSSAPEIIKVPNKSLSSSEWLDKSLMPRMVDQPLTASDVAYVFRKTGYEESPDQIEPWVGVQRSLLVQFLMDNLSTVPVTPKPDWVNEKVRYWGHGDWPESQRSAFRTARQQEIGELRQWWISQMLASPSPMGERMVMFWENTFVAGFSGLDQKSHAQWYHHETIRKYAVTSYPDLLAGMLRDPAVLIYLDNNSNRKDAPNENLARELLELYTLGESHYSEKDIKEAARALAGWHVSEFGDLNFHENDWASDRSRKTIFGRTGNFNGDDLAKLILAHPQASKHVSRRLWKEFISNESPPTEAIEYFSEAFIATGYRIDSLLDVMLNSEYFWNPVYRATSVKSPVELIVGALRSSKQSLMSLQQIDSALSAAGQTLFDPPDVSGWGYGEYWLDPAYLIERESSMHTLAEMQMMQSLPAKVLMSNDKTIKLKLAGEAYQGMPQYRIEIKHDGGQSWSSKSNALKAARDTERLGRYKDESEWIWETQEIEIPSQINRIESVAVRFLYDAAGNGGDRNLFVGGVEWQGQYFPGTSGVQFPGCGNDKEGARRHPDRLYCSGATTLDWTELTRIASELKKKPLNPNPSDLVTRDLAILWFSPPSRKGWQSVDLMFDGLSFGGREWEYFGFNFAKDERGRYLINLTENRCKPSCFKKWPRDAWKDKSGLRHVGIYMQSYDDWSRKQYYQLSSDDKDLMKALLSSAPKVLEKIKNSPRHNEPNSLETWQERLNYFIKKSESGSWKLDQTSQVIELNANRDGNAMKMAMMGSMGMSGNNDSYLLAHGTLKSKKEWKELLSIQTQLGPLPLEEWIVSIDDGERFDSINDWFLSPLINLK